MKKILVALALLSGSFSGMSQEIQMGAMYGYYFGGGLYGLYGESKLIATWAPQYFLSVSPNEFMSIEFNYSAQDTEMRYEEYGFDGVRGYADIRAAYWNLHFLREIRQSDAFRPYGMFGVGLAEFNFDNPTFTDDYRMNIDAGGGIKYLLGDSKKVGIRLQARLIMPVYFAGTSFYFGTGGSGAALTAGSVMLQGAVSGGLFLNLGE